MPSPSDPTPYGDDEVRLSRRLVTLHIAGLVFLVAVVVCSVLWVSTEHNRLARSGSERLVAGGVAAFRAKVDTLVRDYSIWDEAYAAARTDDRDWLYSNIGNAAAEIGTLDLILFVDPRSGTAYGWREGSPPEGETEVLPPDLLETVLGLIDRPGPSRAVFEEMDGEIWAFSVARVQPVAGAPADVPAAEAPRQIHGLKLSQERLDSLAQSLLIDGGLAVAAAPAPGQAALELADAAGAPIAQVVWAAPRPGARILRSLAAPLTAALALAGAIALVSARYAVQSARRLERAVVAARAADRLKSEFLSNVTHELRTPMNGILGAAQLLDLTELDAEQRELLGILETSSRTQMSLINDLLDFARIESGHAALTSAPFAPATTLDEIGGMIQAALASKGVEFETSGRDLEGLMVLGDARAFRQIVTNLLGNASKFTARGRITANASVVRIGRRAEIVVAVTDTGIGIAPEDIDRIFDRFYRVDGSTTRSTDGTGLGLAISQRLAGMMGGRIEVESRLGAGSTFRFHIALPIVEAEAETRDAA